MRPHTCTRYVSLTLSSRIYQCWKLINWQCIKRDSLTFHKERPALFSIIHLQPFIVCQWMIGRSPAQVRTLLLEAMAKQDSPRRYLIDLYKLYYDVLLFRIRYLYKVFACANSADTILKGILFGNLPSNWRIKNTWPKYSAGNENYSWAVHLSAKHDFQKPQDS